MKKIILCADDYGQNETISQAIIALIQKNHLSATSCMTTSSAWLTQAKALLPYQNKVDIGLHFNLTEGQPLSTALQNSHGFLPLGTLIWRAYTRNLDAAALEQELHAQLDRFEEMMGTAPDFIDGHQHVHQFPVIRDVLFKVYEARLKNRFCYVRSVSEHRFLMSFKRLILQLLGAESFKRNIFSRHIPHNTSFSGVYSFQGGRYAKHFPRFLAAIRSGGIIMCHPGLSPTDHLDKIGAARYDEFCYLNSDQFVKDCFANGVVLSRFNNSQNL